MSTAAARPERGHGRRWRPVLAGVLLGALVLAPASMLAGAYFDKPVALSVVLFALAPLVGLVLTALERTRLLGLGVLLGVALFWLAVVPLLSAWLGG